MPDDRASSATSLQPDSLLSIAATSRTEPDQNSNIEITPELIEEITEKVYQLMLADLRIENERKRYL